MSARIESFGRNQRQTFEIEKPNKPAPIRTEELEKQLEQARQRDEEILLLAFIKTGSARVFNPRRVDFLNSARLATEFFLMCLALYCVLVTAIFHIYAISGEVRRWSCGVASGIMAFFNIFRNILIDKIEQEFGLSPMTKRNLSNNILTALRDHLLMTLLILVFPNDLFKILPKFDLSGFYLEFDLIAHLIQLSKLHFVIIYFIGKSVYYSDSSYRIW